MRVVVKLVMEVDADDWVSTYGCDKAGVRDDVKQYFLNIAQDCAPGQEGIITNVELG